MESLLNDANEMNSSTHLESTKNFKHFKNLWLYVEQGIQSFHSQALSANIEAVFNSHIFIKALKNELKFHEN